MSAVADTQHDTDTLPPTLKYSNSSSSLSYYPPSIPQACFPGNTTLSNHDIPQERVTTCILQAPMVGRDKVEPTMMDVPSARASQLHPDFLVS